MEQPIRTVLALAVALAATVAAAVEEHGPQSPAGESVPSALLPLAQARIPMAGVLSGGQPTAEQIDLAARAGYRTVINLRTDEEPGFEWEREAVERWGMRYVHVPVAGAAGLTRENVERIDEELRRGLADGPVLLHCASGNRIGAFLALRAAWLEGADPEDALRVGLEGGLTRLEAATRELLGIGPERPGPEPPAAGR